MFSSIRNFVYRHRKKFIFTGIFIGGAFVANYYLQKKIRDWQEALAKEYIEKTRRKFLFENTERTCNQTTLSFAIKLQNVITETLNTAAVVNSIKNGHVDKVKAWEELKGLVFTQVALIIYAEVMLAIVVRIQVNVVGAQSYQESDENPVILDELQEKYLSQSLYFLGEGIVKLRKYIESKVKPIMDKVSLKQKLYLKDLQEYFWMIQSALSSDNQDPLKNMADFIFPPLVLDEPNPVLKNWLQDTIDILNSNDVQFLATSCISHGFSVVMDTSSQVFLEKFKELPENTRIKENGPSSSGSANCLLNGASSKSVSKSDCINLNDISIPMAKVIPIVNGLLENCNGPNHLNPWINVIISSDKINTLGANIFEGFCPSS
ncbi:unnamed protein product [Bemisia tabaci]|uniref:Peroxisomal biogenesis factor 3 n=1 Tax=Bemisia tabaci TaxID=7038 RepID=A0A9P0A7C9_BEMTA|nr:PREDICTED: peroxisomal biogenesis factor 3 [Bemisia tabaci]XP_018915137.1 PREDICTED: peroxisomal biogenesis factor 3 [Bemisia tabaci]CAH0385476.1 unnamed protein product [Bemisia tabaci]